MMPYNWFLLYALCVLALLLWPMRRRRIVFIVGAVFILLSLGLYKLVGTPGIIPLLAERNERLAALKDSIVVHSEAVKRHPKQLEGWVLLGADFMESRQFAASANAFKQAVILSKGAPEPHLLQEQLVEAMGRSKGKAFTDSPALAERLQIKLIASDVSDHNSYQPVLELLGL